MESKTEGPIATNARDDAALAEVREEGRGEGQRAALRLGILDLCETFGVPMPAERRAVLDAMDVAGLDALRLVLKRDRRWPDGDPSLAGGARPKNFGLGGVDTKQTRRWSAIVTLAALLGITLLTFSPAFFATRSAKAFCSGVTPGTPIADIKVRAESANFGITKLASGGFLFEHPRSLGRATCLVRVDAEGRVSSATAGD